MVPNTSRPGPRINIAKGVTQVGYTKGSLGSNSLDYSYCMLHI